MTNPLSMFHEKADVAAPYSMTRVVAFLFALTECAVLLLYARAAHDINWATAVVAVVTLLAVPLQALFTYLRQWVATPAGEAIVAKAAEELTAKLGHGEHP